MAIHDFDDIRLFLEKMKELRVKEVNWRIEKVTHTLIIFSKQGDTTYEVRSRINGKNLRDGAKIILEGIQANTDVEFKEEKEGFI